MTYVKKWFRLSSAEMTEKIRFANQNNGFEPFQSRYFLSFFKKQVKQFISLLAFLLGICQQCPIVSRSLGDKKITSLSCFLL